jgi:hypothetical protein
MAYPDFLEARGPVFHPPERGPSDDEDETASAAKLREEVAER